MNSFTTRLISAVIGVAVIAGLWFFLGLLGLKVLITLVVLISGAELQRILFRSEDSSFARAAFFFLAMGVFALSYLFPPHAAVIFAFISILFCLADLLALRKFNSLEQLTIFQAKGILGFFYIGLLPSFAIRILDLPSGGAWFATLLAVVFAGDIGAYLAGMSFGRTKLMPLVSPKKTIEGSIGGLLASVIAGAVCAHFLGQSPLILVAIALLTGIVAQFGDLFESQLKRVADVKDSGRIMPGHGGLLDRIDGVLFASPVVLFGAVVLENLL